MRREEKGLQLQNSQKEELQLRWVQNFFTPNFMVMLLLPGVIFRRKTVTEGTSE